jgi:hypothetical protein
MASKLADFPILANFGSDYRNKYKPNRDEILTINRSMPKYYFLEILIRSDNYELRKLVVKTGFLGTFHQGWQRR